MALTPGWAVCLRCDWLATSESDAATAANTHTRTTSHPTAYRPLPHGPTDQPARRVITPPAEPALPPPRVHP